MADRIQIRRDTAANWTTVNPTMAQGEIGWETDSSRIKIGNGTTAWNSLAYWTGQFRERLTAARSYYVRSDGNDSNTGLVNTAGGAFLTIQKAVDTVAALDLGTFDVTIFIGTGTWTAPVTLRSLVGSGECIIRGINADTTSTIISTTSSDCFSGTCRGSYYFRYLKLQTTTSGNCLSVYGGGAFLFYSDINFGTAPSSSHILAARGAYVLARGAYTISGGSYSHFGIYDSAALSLGAFTVTLTGTPAFTGGFCVTSRAASAVIASATFSGSATGSRYITDLNGVIYVVGAGATYLPGSTAGSTATGGQYA